MILIRNVQAYQKSAALAAAPIRLARVTTGPFLAENAVMGLDEFERSLAAKVPPRGIGNLLQALWHDAHGEWDHAHALAQKESGRRAAAVHAYLHRKEGDLGNADYWYQRAARTRPAARLATEWRELVRELLEE